MKFLKIYFKTNKVIITNDACEGPRREQDGDTSDGSCGLGQRSGDVYGSKQEAEERALPYFSQLPT